MGIFVALFLVAVIATTQSSVNAFEGDIYVNDVFRGTVKASGTVMQLGAAKPFSQDTINGVYYPIETAMTNLIAMELGGDPASDPACCSAGKSATYCFIRAVNGYAHYKKIGMSGPWMDMGLWVMGDVACVAHGSEVTVLVVEAKEARIVTNTVRGNKWLGRQYTNAYHPQEVPDCVAMDDDIACMYRGVYGMSFLLYRTKGIWGPPLPQGGLLYSPIGLYYSPKTKELNAYATNKNFHIQIYTKTPATVEGWRQQGNFVMSGRPSICSHGENTIDIFTLGPGSHLLWLPRDATGKYLEWHNEKGDINYPPTCLGSLNRIYCFSVSPTFFISKKIWSKNSWSRWEKVAWGYVGRPSCHFTDSTAKSISCYVRSVEDPGIELFTFHT